MEMADRAIPPNSSIGHPQAYPLLLFVFLNSELMASPVILFSLEKPFPMGCGFLWLFLNRSNSAYFYRCGISQNIYFIASNIPF